MPEELGRAVEVKEVEPVVVGSFTEEFGFRGSIVPASMEA
jgi:hypothetical protein